MAPSGLRSCSQTPNRQVKGQQELWLTSRRDQVYTSSRILDCHLTSSQLRIRTRDAGGVQEDADKVPLLSH